VAGLPDVLIVDDDPGVLEIIRLALEQKGWTCQCAPDAASAIERLTKADYRLILVDVCLPGVSGLDLLAHVRAAGIRSRVVLITDQAQTQHVASALTLGAYDLIFKPFTAAELQSLVAQAMEQQSRQPLALRAANALQMEPQLRHAALESIWALVQAVEAKDPFTRRHSEQVAAYSVYLARELLLPPDDIESLRVGALLHDIGKIGVADHILTKPGPLTPEEFSNIRRHPILGAEILRRISAFAPEARLVRHHHEQWDGGGYPDGLQGTDIPLAARIINVADSIDAMLMKRTYKDAYTVDRVIAELTEGAANQFDPIIAQAAAAWCESHRELLLVPAEAHSAACINAA
jgi:putative nucleotidyltransferase with HDIG domain